MKKFPTAGEMQSLSDAMMRKHRERYGAAPATIEALVYDLQTYGAAALAGPNCQRRLAELSTEQVRWMLERLMRLRPQYPAITDELLFLLGEQL